MQAMVAGGILVVRESDACRARSRVDFAPCVNVENLRDGAREHFERVQNQPWLPEPISVAANPLTKELTVPFHEFRQCSLEARSIENPE
jgi:hypothetical protein